MTSTRRQIVMAQIRQAKVSAIIRTDDQRTAERAMQAAVDGGFRTIEFTMTTPGALELISSFSKRRDMLVGAGTVMSPEGVRSAVEAGASFIVSPICDPSVLAEAARCDVVTIPGAFTPTEMEMAHRAGADIIKIFPAPAGGVDFIRAIRGPLPHLKLFPTAGPTPENFLEYLEAGCLGVGFVRSLFDPKELAAGQFDAVRNRAAKIHERLSAHLRTTA